MKAFYQTEAGKLRIKKFVERNCGKKTAECRKKISESLLFYYRTETGVLRRENLSKSLLLYYRTELGSDRKAAIGNEHRGEKNSFWKGGIWPVNDQIRHLAEYTQWRNRVFARDGYSCRDCNKIGSMLNAHHFPFSFSQIIRKYCVRIVEGALQCKELWDIGNGITLCASCHQRMEILLKYRSACFG